MGKPSSTRAFGSQGAYAVVSALSVSGLAWQLTASATPAPLATAWAANTVYTAGAVVVANGNVYRCTTGGTSAATGGGPTALGTGVTDGTAVWKGVASFLNGFFLTNAAAAGGQSVYWDWGSVSSSTGHIIIASNGLFIPCNDPSLIWVATSTSTALLAMMGMS